MMGVFFVILGGIYMDMIIRQARNISLEAPVDIGI